MTRSAKSTGDEPGVNVKQRSGLNRQIPRSAAADFHFMSPWTSGGHFT
jgi:hypothetical protein